jgi:replicative DNA helicase
MGVLSMAKMFSVQIEKKLLSLFMKSPTHMRVLSTDVDMFAVQSHKNLAKILKKFVSKYRCVPTKKMLISYSNDKITTNDKCVDETAEALEVLQSLPKSEANEFQYCWDKAFNYMVGRKIFDMGVNLQTQYKKNEVNFVDLHREILSDLLMVGDRSIVASRGFIYHNVQERYKEYRETTKKANANVIPFGISALDEKVGGMRKKFLTLFYSKTGGGKTRTAVNIAYNAAKAGYNVVYFSLEMSFNLIASVIDSRMGAINSQEIIFGKLNKEDKQKYKKTLKKQALDKLNIWIVDISLNASSHVLLEETEIYSATTGKTPDLIIVDYANIMTPARNFTNTSDRYNQLFEEYHQIAKYLDSAIITATQESRDASKADLDKKRKSEEIEGVHNIGLSNYMAPHCENVIRIKQDHSDVLCSRVWFIIDKCRYGNTGSRVSATARWATSYVGDRIRTDDLVVVKPESS